MALDSLVTDQFLEVFNPKDFPDDQFYCYVQHRPSGLPFYVGKGRGKRYYHKPSSEKNAAYKRLIEKYGLENIKTDIF